MSRSVAVPGDVQEVAYRQFDQEIDEWDVFVDWVEFTAQELWPSLEKHHRWVGNELQVLLHNRVVSLGISSYGGIVAIWLVPANNLGRSWIRKVSKRFQDSFGGCG